MASNIPEVPTMLLKLSPVPCSIHTLDPTLQSNVLFSRYSRLFYDPQLLGFLFVSLFPWTEMNLSSFSFNTFYSFLKTAKKLISFNRLSPLLSICTIPHTPLLQHPKQCTSCLPYVSVPCIDHEPLKVIGFVSIMCLCRKWYKLAVKDREGGKDRVRERSRKKEGRKMFRNH